MKNFFRDLVNAFIIAGLIFGPFYLYLLFWMKP
jgi:hypothetical protein